MVRQIKKSVENHYKNMCKQGDIVWINFTPQVGREQAGRNPAIIVSPFKYNRLSSAIAPILTFASRKLTF